MFTLGSSFIIGITYYYLVTQSLTNQQDFIMKLINRDRVFHKKDHCLLKSLQGPYSFYTISIIPDLAVLFLQIVFVILSKDVLLLKKIILN